MSYRITFKPMVDSTCNQSQTSDSQSYDFGSFVNNITNNQHPTTMAQPEFIPIESNIPIGDTVGLNVNLIEHNTEVSSEDTPAKMEFNNLVKEAPPVIPEQKFAIQPIPIEMDRSMLPKPVTHNIVDDAIGSVNALINKQPSKTETVGRKLNNWFSRICDQKGSDYITSGKITIDEVSRNAERILDDMISGRIDYSKQGYLIIQPVIIETLLNYCSNKLAISRAIQFGLGYVYNDFTNKQIIQSHRDFDRLSVLNRIDDGLSRNITQSISIVNQDIGVYEVLYNKLQYVQITQNASSLFSLTNDLNNFRKQMKRRY